MLPPSNSAHVWSPRADTATAVLTLNTDTGLDRSVVVPSPSCPALFRPQHLTDPLDTVHVCVTPADSVVSPLQHSSRLPIVYSPDAQLSHWLFEPCTWFAGHAAVHVVCAAFT